MIEKIETLDELATHLYDDPSEIRTVSHLVGDLVSLGDKYKVYVWHDDYYGLKIDLSTEFLYSPIEEADVPHFEEEVNLVLEQANIIIPYSERR